jgi:hypothetical protein
LYPSVLADARFHDLLFAFDQDLADATRHGGCALCGGVLHSARYWRKPRGQLCRLGKEHDQRFSFCCAVDGCRTRATPPSLRFLGRAVYLAATLVLISIMRHGPAVRRMQRLTVVVGVDRRTVERWRIWWRERFPASPFWRAVGAGFMPPVDRDRLPAVLIERFSGDDTGRLIALLRFIAPAGGVDGHGR